MNFHCNYCNCCVIVRFITTALKTRYERWGAEVFRTTYCEAAMEDINFSESPSAGLVLGVSGKKYTVSAR